MKEKKSVPFNTEKKPIPDEFLPKISPDQAWIKRRENMPLCPERLAMDLRQLADEIEEYAAQQRARDDDMRELLGVPRHVKFVR